MKVAISSQGKDLHSNLDERFGRANFFLLMDSNSQKVLTVLDNNEAKDMPHGAGIQAALKVVEADADVVLTGIMGPKAFSLLQAAGVKVISGLKGNINDVLDKFLSENFSPDQGPTSHGHV